MESADSRPLTGPQPAGPGPRVLPSKVPAVVGIGARGWKGDPNNGNLLHGAAARRLLAHYSELQLTAPWTDAEIEDIRSRYSHIIYVTANAIRLGLRSGSEEASRVFAFQELSAENISRAGLPVVVLGLGAQSSIEGPHDFDVAPETRRLLNVISDHSRKIAVRGEFTADVCRGLGIKNVEVVGCQSFFWHLTPHFSQQLSDPIAHAGNDIAFNYTNAAAEAPLINQAMSLEFDMIGQGNIAEEQIITGEIPTDFGWWLSDAFARGLIDQARYERWIRSRFYQFHDAESWIGHMGRYRVSYGTRFHGNMAGLIAGARALWVIHDMRTKELCDLFKLPGVTLQEVREGICIAELMERADYLACIKIYPDRYRVVFDYLQDARVPHVLPVPHGGKWQLTSPDVSRAATTMTSGRAPVGIENVIQARNDTSYDRYPWVFSAASKYSANHRPVGRAVKILSFGCSRGEEVFTLVDKYFTTDEQVTGVDILEDQINLARSRNRFPHRVSFELSSREVIRASAPYDLIFAMSVLCAWPDAMDQDDISEIFSFERFSEILNELDEFLEPGNLLVIFNANYRFCDTTLYEKYRCVPVPGAKKSGFISKFDRASRRQPQYDLYNEVLFVKNA